MIAAIFSGGEFDSVSILQYDILICADKGYKYAQKLNLKPNYIIGDFDSLGYVPKNAEVYPVKKDASDTQIAIDKAIDLGASEIHLYYSLGGRIDHLLFNINLIKYAKDKGAKLKIISKDCEIFLVDKSVEFSTVKGNNVSLVPFSNQAHIIDSSGLYYPLKNVIVKKGETLTLSNVAVKKEVKIEVESGELIVVNFL